EGKAFWLLRSAPLPLREVLRAKLLAGLLPSLLLGSVTIGLTSWLLGSPALLVAISLITVWALALLVAGMGTGLGALFPSFEAENASRIAAGFGGIVYMVLTMSAILLVLLLAAWPVYLLHRTFVLQQQGGFPLRYWLIAGLCGLLAAGVLGLATWLPLRLGEKSLGEKE
ncbi:MAG: hypothetical protein FJ125_01525, partial [Deltaproteobacteria bacterium]|nr:hypothetical protein [Deltaproteobacteria bacterium]